MPSSTHAVLQRLERLAHAPPPVPRQPAPDIHSQREFSVAQREKQELLGELACREERERKAEREDQGEDLRVGGDELWAEGVPMSAR